MLVLSPHQSCLPCSAPFIHLCCLAATTILILLRITIHACSCFSLTSIEAAMALDDGRLLCSEDISGCLYDDGIVGYEGKQDERYCVEHQALSTFAVCMEKRCDVVESIAALSERETFFMPRDDYSRKYQVNLLDAIDRKKAIDWIVKMRSLYGFRALTVALAINYLDRFLSLYELPSGKTWMVQLLSIACLSMAAKMEETDVPLLLDLQVGSDYLFEPRIVQRMELLLGSTLDWRMSFVTPFSYTNYLIGGISLSSKAQSILYAKLDELVLCIVQELGLVEFFPSAKAAAATLYCLSELWPHDFESYKKNLLSVLPKYVQVSSMKCFKEVGKLVLSRSSVKNVFPQSPACVLDSSFSSSSNNDTESLVKCAGSDANNYTLSLPSKRIMIFQDQQNLPSS